MRDGKQNTRIPSWLNPLVFVSIIITKVEMRNKKIWNASMRCSKATLLGINEGNAEY